jgi:hypothetical protein
MQFIYRAPGLIPKSLCNQIIKTFEKSKFQKPGIAAHDNGNHSERMVYDHVKVSTDISFEDNILKNEEFQKEWGMVLHKLYPLIREGVDAYVDKFQHLNTLSKFTLEAFNIQKYNPGEGFFPFHCENSGSGIGALRVLAWMAYLNDVPDGGTEFLYQDHIETAEQGKLMIWPAYWTHTHKGQISNTTTKYILTGWFTCL